MLEIIIIVAVVKAFTKKAKEKNFNKVLWGFIGAGSYYIPILIMSFVVFPYLIDNAVFNFSSQTQFLIISILINLALGISCCFIIYQVLKNAKANLAESDSNILDSELT